VQNSPLGKFEIPGIPPAPRDASSIAVTFRIDAIAIVNTSATDKYTGSTITITTKNRRLFKEEIKRAISEGTIYQKEDEEPATHHRCCDP
jgi:molecular chaperone DnaK (HSP70)